MKKIMTWLLAFLLTGSLVLFCVSYIGRSAVAPALGDQGAKVSGRVIAAEKELIREKINDMAALYGFTAEPVIAVISDDVLNDLNARASLWWSSVLADGTPGQQPKMDTQELRQVLSADPLVSRGENPEAQAETIADAVSQGVVRIVLPMRQETLNIGMREAGKRVDLVNLFTFFIRVPWAALALSALLAGLIALLESRQISGCLKYIGAALGAAAIVLIAISVLMANAGIRPMILEASRSLAIQYDSVLTEALIRAGALAAVLTAGSVLCLICFQRSRNKHEA